MKTDVDRPDRLLLVLKMHTPDLNTFFTYHTYVRKLHPEFYT